MLKDTAAKERIRVWRSQEIMANKQLGSYYRYQYKSHYMLFILVKYMIGISCYLSFGWYNVSAQTLPQKQTQLPLQVQPDKQASVPAKEVNTQTTEQAITMSVGTIKVITLANIARVAVGNSKVIQANTDNDKELVLFARDEGKTTLEVWDSQGQRYSFAIDVRSAKEQELKEDILQIIKRIPHVRASIVGEKIIVEGDRLRDADRERLQKLMVHYPQIVDMSSQIGWDEMVMLDVQIVELPRHYIQELGVRWGVQGGFQLGGMLETYSGALLDRPAQAIMNTALGARAGYTGVSALLSSTIQAMADNGQAVILAQPQLMARSGATAEFLAGGEVPYAVADANGNTQTIFKPYGVSLYITPRIEKNGIIRSKINVEVSAVDSSMNVAGGPALKTRRTSTEFNVKSGDPLVLSGFISRDHMQSMARLPGASEIPILGELFRSRRFQSNETELVIIVRPLVVSSHNPQMKQRVIRTNAIIDSSFENKPLINVAIQPDQFVLDQHKSQAMARYPDRKVEKHLQFSVRKQPPALRKLDKKSKTRAILPLTN